MTYNVFGGMLNLAQLQDITHSSSSEVSGYLRETESMLQLHDASSELKPTYTPT